MSFFSEFKAFAMKGNVIDLAVGIVIGAAFGKIVNSLVEAIIMPIVGVLTGGFDFSKRAITVGTAEIKWGLFIQSCVEFFIIAFALFVVIKAMNRMNKKEAPAPPAEPVLSTQEKLLIEIRDELKKK